MESQLYKTKLGKMLVGDFVEISRSFLLRYYENKFNLILTSPPFPLNKKKRYGNFQGNEYREWFVKLAPIFSKLLADDGSLIIEVGNAWENKRPVQSLLHLECLFGLVKNPRFRFASYSGVYLLQSLTASFSRPVGYSQSLPNGRQLHARMVDSKKRFT